MLYIFEDWGVDEQNIAIPFESDADYRTGLVKNPEFVRYYLSNELNYPTEILKHEIMYIYSLFPSLTLEEFKFRLVPESYSCEIIKDYRGERISSSYVRYQGLCQPEMNEFELALQAQKMIPIELVPEFEKFLTDADQIVENAISYNGKIRFKNPEITSVCHLFMSTRK